MKICGIDDAGRGPVIGPLVMAGILIEEKDEPKLRKIKVKDSKLLTPKQRTFLFPKIIKIVEDYKIVIVSPQEVDRAVKKDDGLNLNWLEANKSIEIIEKLKPDLAILDSPSNNIKAYKSYVEHHLKYKTQIQAEHKADLNYPVVSAASILAKVTRDKEIEKIKKQIGIDFGSGYMTDPKTTEFLTNSCDKYPEIFRHSWYPCKKIMDMKKQQKLDKF